jgi:hypothetical protein
MNKEELKDRIRKAFANVALGNGVGLREGNAADDYKTAADQAIERQSDEKHDWSRISTDDLWRYHCALSYMDPEGMRFHLPAYLIAEVEGESDVLLYHLTTLSDHSFAQRTALTAEQREAVVAFLYWTLDERKYESKWPMVERVLLEYWQADA